jgi:S1-C subfamily serine protease
MNSPLSLESSTALDASVARLLRRAVSIRVARGRTVSGIVWRDRYIVTAAEAAAGAEKVRVRSFDAAGGDGPPESAGDVLAIDLTTDVAVVALAEPLGASQPQPLEVRKELRLGERVAVVACDARGPLATWGTVLATGPAWRSRRGGDIAQRLELDVIADRRLEGALIADGSGGAAAMLVSGPRGWLGIPAVTIERVLGTVEKFGHLPRPYLGLRLQNLWLEPTAAARFGRSSARVAVIAGVEPDSPAASAHLEPGDLIDTIDGREADGVDDLTRALASAAPGTTLALGVRRGGESQSRSVTAAERPPHSP